MPDTVEIPDALRDAVLVRDAQCEWCGRAGGPLTVHRRSERAPVSLANLITIHVDCQRMITAPDDEFEAAHDGFVLSEDQSPRSTEIRIADRWWLLGDDGSVTPSDAQVSS